jgi:RNA polymerase sigma factor (sigma-70 family)
MHATQRSSHPNDVERLYRDYGAAAGRWALRLARSPADAEDLVQEAFLVAHRRRMDLPDAGHAGPWLFRIVENAARHLWRRRRRSRLVGTDRLPELADGRPTALEVLEQRRRLAAVGRAMATLCARDRRLLLPAERPRAPASAGGDDAPRPATQRVRRHRARLAIARRLRALDVISDC